MSDEPKWTKVANEARAALHDSIPPEWRIAPKDLPAESRLDVTGFPAESGILLRHELDITESDAGHILRKLAAGEWTS